MPYYYGTNGNDSIGGTASADVMYGYAGNDRLYGYAGDDVLYGMDGNDFLQGGAGADWLDGGAGIDTADYNGAAGVYVNLATGYGYYGEAAGDRLFNIENVQGTTGYGDTLIGSAVANVLSGYGGNDSLIGNDGNDTLYGMDGNDYLHGGNGADWLDGGSGIDSAEYYYGTAGVWIDLSTTYGYFGQAAGDRLFNIENVYGTASYSDTLIGSAVANVLSGYGGNDYLEGGAGADTLYGGSDIDSADYYDSTAGVWVSLTSGYGYYGDAAGDRLYDIENLYGSASYGDTLIGSAANNSLYGYGGSDYLYGYDGNDLLSGADGNDYLYGGAGADALYGGAGVDSAEYYSGTTGVWIDLSTTYGYYGEAAGDRLYDVETVYGTASYSDTLIGSAADNSLYGYGGYDYLYGSAGNDTLSGGDSNDYLEGGAGADMLYGGTGVDAADYYDSTVGVWVDLSTGYGYYGDAAGDRLYDIETVYGSASYGDTLIGSAANDSLYGYGGADRLYGNAGDDTLSGGAGNDYLQGGTGADTLYGGTDNDTADYYASTAGVWIDLGTTYGYYGDAAGDRLYDIETVYGSASYGDTLIGSAVNNSLYGYGGNDGLYGQDGNDYLSGGDGNDYLSGGNGGDTLIGAAGQDTLVGGAGADRFVYETLAQSPVGAGADRITDFSHAQADRIDLSAIDANTGVAGNQAFVFGGAGAGGLHFVFSGFDTLITGDVNGDGTADFSIVLSGNIALAAADFVL
ncbi:calcium-binding protein [Inquilinus sp. CA228]|uniref:calcium-binding protein n=1 Tax=Inquilinus sp. CA228 TaxID=3455609 RepID=UPI003F8D1A9C